MDAESQMGITLYQSELSENFGNEPVDSDEEGSVLGVKVYKLKEENAFNF
jgi:hypothetical protein